MSICQTFVSHAYSYHPPQELFAPPEQFQRGCGHQTPTNPADRHRKGNLSDQTGSMQPAACWNLFDFEVFMPLQTFRLSQYACFWLKMLFFFRACLKTFTHVTWCRVMKAFHTLSPLIKLYCASVSPYLQLGAWLNDYLFALAEFNLKIYFSDSLLCADAPPSLHLRS